jgi:hypothetical protein
MQDRTKTLLLQVYLAIVCALGAGFSGDMLARTAGHATHHGRHTRGTQHRGARSSGRDTQGEHAQEVEIAQDSSVSADSADHNLVAILPQRAAVAVAWTNLGFAPVVREGFALAAERFQLPARGPPTVA